MVLLKDPLHSHPRFQALLEEHRVMWSIEIGFWKKVYVSPFLPQNDL